MSTDQSQLANAASELRTIGDRVRRMGGSFLAPFLADQTANIVDRFGRYLEETNGDRLLADAERFARAQPWALVTITAATGFAVSRMLKASSTRRYHATLEEKNLG
jgi:ElaB/YqjD/DUF883 family membrane-anchored ribosome-binding protein